MKKILIVKTSAIGDVLQTFGVLHYLKKKFPLAQVDWVVDQPSQVLLEAHPMIHRVIVMDMALWKMNWKKRNTWQKIKFFLTQLKKERYDVIFDLQGNVKSAFVTFYARGKKKVGFGFRTVSEWPNLFVTSFRYNPSPLENKRIQYLELVQRYFGDTKQFVSEQALLFAKEKEKILPKKDCFNILVCPGSRWPNKQLSEKSWVELLQLFNKTFSCFFFLVGDGIFLEKYFEKNFFKIPKSTLPELQNFMKKVDFVLAVDSSLLHLCGTTNTPNFGIFGPTKGSIFAPMEKKCSFFQGVCPYGKTFDQRCTKLRSCKTGNCLKNVDVKDIFNAWLEKNKK